MFLSICIKTSLGCRGGIWEAEEADTLLHPKLMTLFLGIIYS